MIELEDTRGLVKSFRLVIAESELRKSEGRKARGQNYWSIPEGSKYKLYKGSLVVKKKIVD